MRLCPWSDFTRYGFSGELEFFELRLLFINDVTELKKSDNF
jgi:hypothetical protein